MKNLPDGVHEGTKDAPWNSEDIKCPSCDSENIEGMGLISYCCLDCFYSFEWYYGKYV